MGSFRYIQFDVKHAFNFDSKCERQEGVGAVGGGRETWMLMLMSRPPWPPFSPPLVFALHTYNADPSVRAKTEDAAMHGAARRAP